MFKRLQFLSWAIMPAIIFFLITGFDKCTGNPPPVTNPPPKNCDSLKPVGKIINSKNIKSVDSLKRETTRNLNAIHRYGAGSFIVAGDSGTIMITPNGGLNWLLPASGTLKNLYGSVINDYDTMMVVGESGKVIRSNNRGVTWNNINSGTTKTLRSVCFPTKFTGYSSGDSGIVIKTTDAGLSWSTIYSFDTTGSVRSIYFADSLTGWFCTSKGRIYKSINGGSSWSIQYSNSSVSLNCISFNGTSKGTAVGSGGTIVETNNGGSTWILSAYNAGVDLYGVHRVNDNLAFICGKGKIIRESNSTMAEILNNPAYKFNAVDPDPYIMGLSVADLGLITEVSVSECDCTNKNDLVMFPTEENNKWRISIRLNHNSNFRDYIRIIVPGFEFDNNVLTGWTQSDQVGTVDPSLDYIASNSSNSQGPQQVGSYSVSGVNDVVTLNLTNRHSAFLNLDLTVTSLNSTQIGSVNFFYGNSGTDYCASVKYILGN
ncbi:MAG TPA: YCF48-related protein [Ignavibacteria bacterium]|nr:hypothetical protein [Bacteroidota bacterium]HRE09743.1 YCF48-related protein [Ignavibacteria bacterium]HRF65530.1 YCF48-related protein [Ignavibacteria bacterium]HRJ02974.1 YCF48-related protein [Ignavibacteria bacterium]HRJ84211.1 YCF48-related protein [Ignavibacteria bacterium]